MYLHKILRTLYLCEAVRIRNCPSKLKKDALAKNQDGQVNREGDVFCKPSRKEYLIPSTLMTSACAQWTSATILTYKNYMYGIAQNCDDERKGIEVRRLNKNAPGVGD